MMKFYLLFVLGLVSFSSHASLFAPEWLLPMIDRQQPVWSLRQAQESPALYDCGLEEEDREFCADRVSYYNVEVEGRLFIQDGRVGLIELTAPFSSFTYSELQLNLRKDGYLLAKIVVNGSEYDVLAELEHKSAQQVDKEVVRFLNSRHVSAPRELTWISKPGEGLEQESVMVVFHSGSEGISVSFSSSQKD